MKTEAVSIGVKAKTAAARTYQISMKLINIEIKIWRAIVSVGTKITGDTHMAMELFRR